jgi:hypothetical protein
VRGGGLSCPGGVSALGVDLERGVFRVGISGNTEGTVSGDSTTIESKGLD